MTCKAVYLTPRSSYKAALRSDTLWGALCWAIRLLHGPDTLKKLIRAYDSEEQDKEHKPFYISSAMPFVQQGGRRHPFLPMPLHQAEREKLPDGFEEVKRRMREWKSEGKEGMLDKSLFEYTFCGRLRAPAHSLPAPALTVRPMTHNTIDRLTGSTLSIGGRGQLFHTEERFVQAQHPAGLYFLVRDESDLLESALRYLEHRGIGGDLSIGKGRFDISWDDFELEEPQDANALMALSLYHPTKEELQAYQDSGSPALNYKTIVRQGWKSASLKKPVLYFEEGSVFPLPETKKMIFGRNLLIGEHEDEHPITQYGHGFMVKIKVPTYEN